MEQDGLKLLAQQEVLSVGGKRGMASSYLLTGERLTGLSQASDFSSVACTHTAAVLLPLFTMLVKKDMKTVGKCLS